MKIYLHVDHGRILSINDHGSHGYTTISLLKKPSSKYPMKPLRSGYEAGFSPSFVGQIEP